MRFLLIFLFFVFTSQQASAEENLGYSPWKSIRAPSWWPADLTICGEMAERFNLRLSKKPETPEKERYTGFDEQQWHAYISPPDSLEASEKVQLLTMNGKSKNMRFSIMQDAPSYALGKDHTLVRYDVGYYYPDEELYFAPNNEASGANYQNIMTGQMICGGKENDDPFMSALCRAAYALPIDDALKELNDDLKNNKFPNPLEMHGESTYIPNEGIVAWPETLPPSYKDTGPAPTAILAVTASKYWESSPDYPALAKGKIPARIAFFKIMKQTDRDSKGAEDEFQLTPIQSCVLEQTSKAATALPPVAASH